MKITLGHDCEPPEFIHEALLGYYAQESATVEVVQESVLTRAFSTVRFLKVKSDDTLSRVVSKTIALHEVNRAFWEDENQAAVEFTILQDLYKYFSAIPRCSVPKPLLLLPEHTTYLMDFVPGDTIDILLKGARGFCPSLKWQKTLEHYRHTGMWLNHFQAFTGLTFEGADALSSLTKRMNERLKELHLKCDDPGFIGILETQVQEIFRVQAERLSKSGERVPVCGRHGDFGGWNILFNDDGVTVIDFMGYGRDPAVMDMVKMLICFHDNEEYLGYRKIRVQELRDAFIAGYDSADITPEPVWIMCETYYRLCSIIACQQIADLRWDRRWMKKRVLKKHIKWFADAKRAGPAAIEPLALQRSH